MLKFPSWKDITYLLLGVCTRILYKKKKYLNFGTLHCQNAKGMLVKSPLPSPSQDMIAVLGGVAVEHKRKIIDDLR